jgi:hypothetical protein
MSAPVLTRVAATFTPEGIELAVRYRRQGGPNHGSRQRAREIEELVRSGLNRVARALDEGEVTVVGEAGFEVREDVIAVDTKNAKAS